MIGKTLAEQLEEYGIKEDKFSEFYKTLKSENRLPDGAAFPEDQYSAIVQYLKDNLVLKGEPGKDMEIDKKGLKLFDSKISLEQIMQIISARKKKDDKTLCRISRSGGIVSCRHDDDFSLGSNGGIMPCRH